jgi:hypothetical protein
MGFEKSFLHLLEWISHEFPVSPVNSSFLDAGQRRTHIDYSEDGVEHCNGFVCTSLCRSAMQWFLCSTCKDVRELTLILDACANI